uniref:Ganglioside induced differentiation associated protein 2 n=1 Tax=Oncorhynchus mykiss TaxID=8022 RepID=A0A8C7VUR4_ONCMY
MTPSFFTECNCSMSPLGGSVVILAGCWAYLLVVCVSTGVDMCGRTVMVLVGRNIPVTLIAMEKALLYFIHVMDHITVKEYVMVYFHTLTGEHNHLDSEFLKKLHEIVDTKFKNNLRAFYFVHPSFRSKVSTWFFTTFSVSGMKQKVHHVETLQQLFTCILPEQIDIPPFVLEYDARET